MLCILQNVKLQPNTKNYTKKEEKKIKNVWTFSLNNVVNIQNPLWKLWTLRIFRTSIYTVIYYVSCWNGMKSVRGLVLVVAIELPPSATRTSYPPTIVSTIDCHLWKIFQKFATIKSIEDLGNIGPWSLRGFLWQPTITSTCCQRQYLIESSSSSSHVSYSASALRSASGEGGPPLCFAVPFRAKTGAS